MLERDDIFRFIETESAAAAATITAASLDQRVPSCPDWSLTELMWHLGRVQRFWALVAHSGLEHPPHPVAETSELSEANALDEWFRESTRALLDALHTVPWETPAWTWWNEDKTVGAIARHQVQEAAVHRWDAQLAATGKPDPLPAELANDGVDEFLWISRQLRGDVPIAFHTTDTGTTFAAGDEQPVVTASASASDLVLLLYSRLTPNDVEISGNSGALEGFLVAIG